MYSEVIWDSKYARGMQTSLSFYLFYFSHNSLLDTTCLDKMMRYRSTSVKKEVQQCGRQKQKEKDVIQGLKQNTFDMEGNLKNKENETKQAQTAKHSSSIGRT